MMFLETICLLQGKVQNKIAHEVRMQQTAFQFGFKAPPLPFPPTLSSDNTYNHKIKWRIVYREKIIETSCALYYPKKITSLKLVESMIDYRFKEVDRTSLEELLQQKGDCDEILITRDGFVSDTSYSNIVLQKGDRYFTPSTPLLNGTKRQQLLLKGVVSEQKIHRNSLGEYDRIFLINALLDIEDDISVPIENISE